MVPSQNIFNYYKRKDNLALNNVLINYVKICQTLAFEYDQHVTSNPLEKKKKKKKKKKKEEEE